MSYELAERDVAYLTGIRVPAKTQQRLVHCQTFPPPRGDESMAELGVDGGKVRVRTPLAQACQWRDLHCHLHRPRHGCQLSKQCSID